MESRALFLLTFFISVSFLTNWLDRAERHFYGVKPGVIMAGEDFSGLLPGEVKETLQNMAIRYQKLPQEPRIDKETGEIYAEKLGQIVNIDKCFYKITTAQESQKLQLEIITIFPRYSSKDLQKANNPIGYYATSMQGSFQRHTNIKLAAQALNNTLLWPKDVFSFNDIVGPRSPERGYLPAPVILQGEMNVDYGGGVCQVASTVYNAAINAGLVIIERHQHSKMVRYVPTGRDATVNYGYLDLKFKNNFDTPIIIKAGVSEGNLWVRILGGGK